MSAARVRVLYGVRSTEYSPYVQMVAAAGWMGQRLVGAQAVRDPYSSSDRYEYVLYISVVDRSRFDGVNVIDHFKTGTQGPRVDPQHIFRTEYIHATYSSGKCSTPYRV